MTSSTSERTVLDSPTLRVSTTVAEERDQPTLVLKGCSAQLRRIARAHRRVRSPHIPSVLRHRYRPGEEELELECDAVAHLGDVIDLLAEDQTRPALPVGLALYELLCDTLETAHQAGEYLGALCSQNLLVGPSGGVWLLGLGHNFPAMRHAAGYVEAPEVFLGHPADASSDVYALFAWVCAMLPLTPPPPQLAAALSGTAGRPLRGMLHHLRFDALALDPLRRPSTLARLRERLALVRRVSPALLPPPDHQGLRHLIARSVQVLLRRRAASGSTYPPSAGEGDTAPPTLQVTSDLSQLVVDGHHVVDLSTRLIIRRLLDRLIRQHRTRPGIPLSIGQLQQAGWPDERMMKKAARARIYVAVSTLRRLGLRDIIVNDSGGYCLDPQTLVSPAPTQALAI